MLGFVYISLKQRRKSLLRKNDNDVKTIIFAGDYEKFIDNGVTRELYYIGAPDGLAAIYVKPQSGQANMYYAHTDHLGSIVSLTDNAGVAVFKASYDAWGKQTVSLNTIGFYRGYTGHEHLPEFGLINMNGRMYDPVLGRFLSPDPYIQDPANTQSYNRYSYCMNNPLTYADPSGEIIPWFYFAGQLLGNYLFGVADNSINKKMPMNQAAKQFNFNMSYSPSANRFFMPGVDAQMSAWNMETSQRPAYTSTGSWRQVNAYAGGYDDLAYQYTTWKYVPLSGGGDQTNWGLYVTGAVLTVEDIYNNFYHNHTTYKTLAGEVKNIYKANGAVRSARAAQFARTSTAVKVLGTTGTVLMTATAGYNIATGNGTVLDYSDATVGATGLTAGAVTWATGYTGYAIPVVGEGVALYSWGRLWFDLGTNYGPSKWYGNDNTQWFK